MKNSLICAAVGATALVSSADAGFLGFVASVRVSGAYTLVDIYAGVQNSSDRFLGVYNINSTTSVAGGFFQAAGLATKAWKPNTTDASSVLSTRNAIDSFMTAGGTDYLIPEGMFAAPTTTADPNFTSTSWNGTPGSAAATTVPVNAGWYSNDPTASTNTTESIVGLAGRVNGSGSADQARYGIWIAHLVLATNDPIAFGFGTGNLFFGGFAGIKDGVTGSTSQGYSAIPAPGALSLLAAAGLCGGMRRRRA